MHLVNFFPRTFKWSKVHKGKKVQKRWISKNMFSWCGIVSPGRTTVMVMVSASVVFVLRLWWFVPPQRVDDKDSDFTSLLVSQNTEKKTKTCQASVLALSIRANSSHFHVFTCAERWRHLRHWRKSPEGMPIPQHLYLFMGKHFNSAVQHNNLRPHVEADCKTF